MNRKIKFRVWNGKKFVQSPKYIKTATGELFSYEADYGGMFSSHESLEKYSGTVQQYTGIKDRNDKEIYEGDIISCLGRDFKEESRHEVKYGSGGFYLNKKDFLWYGVKHGIYEDGEIIGNIFENPELIKSEQ